jgi:ring-1,2-phenylacetyl-CoA epoxidase subunit PaaC
MTQKINNLNYPKEQALFNYTIHLADSSLIMGHRLSEWTGYGPMLEQDIAISNIALDLIGQSRNFYQYAATITNSNTEEVKNITEDDLAYLRDTREFKNHLITELPNGDWGKTILKIFFFSAWQFYFYQKLIYSSDKQLSAIAEKSLKEVTYHLRWSSEWVIRLGDGTEESKKRILLSLEELWPFTGEMFEPADYEKELFKEHISVFVSEIKNDWINKVKNVFTEATIDFSKEGIWMQTGGKNGVHTEHLGYILAEMQFLQRAYPGCEW